MIETIETPAIAQPTPTPTQIRPDGFVGLKLDRRQMEIYLHLVHVGMEVPEILAAQRRAIEIRAAHDEIGAMYARPELEL